MLSRRSFVSGSLAFPVVAFGSGEARALAVPLIKIVGDIALGLVLYIGGKVLDKYLFDAEHGSKPQTAEALGALAQGGFSPNYFGSVEVNNYNGPVIIGSFDNDPQKCCFISGTPNGLVMLESGGLICMDKLLPEMSNSGLSPSAVKKLLAPSRPILNPDGNSCTGYGREHSYANVAGDKIKLDWKTVGTGPETVGEGKYEIIGQNGIRKFSGRTNAYKIVNC
jgi:hypothetical protein